MLNFQNFYITKGPTTSAEKYPASTKSVRQPRPCRGETLALHQLSAVTECARGPGTFTFLSLLEDFNAFNKNKKIILRSEPERGGGKNNNNTGYFGEKHNVSDLPRTSSRRRGKIYLLNVRSF